MPQIPGVEFTVTEVEGAAHIVLTDTSKGGVRVEQSMMFSNQAEFDDWCGKERRRLDHPHAYEQLIRSVSSIFKNEDWNS